jgi:hypothetical protein
MARPLGSTPRQDNAQWFAPNCALNSVVSDDKGAASMNKRAAQV